MIQTLIPNLVNSTQTGFWVQNRKEILGIFVLVLVGEYVCRVDFYLLDYYVLMVCVQVLD